MTDFLRRAFMMLIAFGAMLALLTALNWVFSDLIAPPAQGSWWTCAKVREAIKQAGSEEAAIAAAKAQGLSDAQIAAIRRRCGI